MSQINEFSKPYNKRSKKRAFAWKVAEKWNRGRLRSMYKHVLYHPSKLMQSVDKSDFGDSQPGFHVCPTKADAMTMWGHRSYSPDYCIIRVEVEGFISSGVFRWNTTLRTERWDRMRILKVYK